MTRSWCAFALAVAVAVATTATVTAADAYETQYEVSLLSQDAFKKEVNTWQRGYRKVTNIDMYCELHVELAGARDRYYVVDLLPHS